MIGGHILAESSDFLTTESGDQLVTEDFVADAVTEPDVPVEPPSDGGINSSTVIQYFSLRDWDQTDQPDTKWW